MSGDRVRVGILAVGVVVRVGVLAGTRVLVSVGLGDGVFVNGPELVAVRGCCWVWVPVGILVVGVVVRVGVGPQSTK